MYVGLFEKWALRGPRGRAIMGPKGLGAMGRPRVTLTLAAGPLRDSLKGLAAAPPPPLLPCLGARLPLSQVGASPHPLYKEGWRGGENTQRDQQKKERTALVRLLLPLHSCPLGVLVLLQVIVTQGISLHLSLASAP